MEFLSERFPDVSWACHGALFRLPHRQFLLSRLGYGMDENPQNGRIEESLTESAPGLNELAQRFGIRVILQFGSTVTGTTHEGSDLDLAVQLDTPAASLETILEIQEALQVQFPGRKVDVAILNRADPLFRKKIMEACRLLFGTFQDFARLRLYSFKIYQDFQPYLAIERQFVARRLSALVAEPSRP
jgi:predicted nucleotidyltransferase